MPLRVAFDLDGTVADMATVLQRESEHLFGRIPSDVTTQGADGLTLAEGANGDGSEAQPLTLDDEQRSRLWRHVQTIPNFWATLPEIEPGLVQRIAELVEERRWEVIFLTTRPAVTGLTTQQQSQKWLDAHGFRWPSVFVVQRSRGRIAEALQLDAVVDDRSENAIDVALESKATAFWVDRTGGQVSLPAAKRLGVRVVSTTAAAVDQLIKLDNARESPGVVGKIKRMFREAR